MYKIILLRHGESIWNNENLFTGWTDVDLSEKGIKEAHEAARLLEADGYTFDIAFTSVLKRAIRTLWIVLDDMDLMWIPVRRSWRLNERMYGDLQGLNKAETASKFGQEQVHVWRRSYDSPPPAMDIKDKRHPLHDRRYAHLPMDEVPATECLKDTVERFLSYWVDAIVPEIKEGKRVIIAAHGNSLRALVKYLDNISDEEIPDLNIPTGVPLVYELDAEMHPIRHYYLGDQDSVQAAINAVKNQAKKK